MSLAQAGAEVGGGGATGSAYPGCKYQPLRASSVLTIKALEIRGCFYLRTANI